MINRKGAQRGLRQLWYNTAESMEGGKLKSREAGCNEYPLIMGRTLRWGEGGNLRRREREAVDTSLDHQGGEKIGMQLNMLRGIRVCAGKENVK